MVSPDAPRLTRITGRRRRPLLRTPEPSPLIGRRQFLASVIMCDSTRRTRLRYSSWSNGHSATMVTVVAVADTELSSVPLRGRRAAADPMTGLARRGELFG